MTTVKDLIAELQEYPEDWRVVLAADAEGNGFAAFGALCDGFAEPEDRGSWMELTFPDYSEDEDVDYTPNTLVLWPV